MGYVFRDMSNMYSNVITKACRCFNLSCLDTTSNVQANYIKLLQWHVLRLYLIYLVECKLLIE